MTIGLVETLIWTFSGSILTHARSFLIQLLTYRQWSQEHAAGGSSGGSSSSCELLRLLQERMDAEGGVDIEALERLLLKNRF